MRGKPAVPSPAELGPIRAPGVLTVGQEIALGAEAMKGLAFREINVKEAFTLVDAENRFFRASLKAADAHAGRALVYEAMPGSPESPLRITLLCAVLGRQRMIQVVQKATELGVVRIAPVISEKSVQPKDLDHEKPWAWPGQAKKGARQCRRASVPEVLPVTGLDVALRASWWTDARARFVMDDRSEGADPFTAHDDAADAVLAVGPEGGWSDAERTKLLGSARALVLGTRVLRAETAVFAGLAVLQHRLGDLHA